MDILGRPESIKFVMKDDDKTIHLVSGSSNTHTSRVNKRHG